MIPFIPAACLRSADICIPVADHEGACGIDAPCLHQVLDHAGAGFAATAQTAVPYGRVMRAVAHRIQPSALASQVLTHVLVDGLYVSAGVEPPGDTGLVGDDKCPKAGSVDQFDSLNCTRQPAEFIPLMQKADVLVQAAVAVEKHST